MKQWTSTLEECSSTQSCKIKLAATHLTKMEKSIKLEMASSVYFGNPLVQSSPLSRSVAIVERTLGRKGR